MSRITELLPPDDSPGDPPPRPPLDQAAELRPCPFCGGKAELESCGTDHTIGCVDPTCEVYAVAGPFETASKVIEVWNHRGGWKP